MAVIYFIISFFATTIGAVAGIGGGVIIKPILDLMGHYDVSVISALSSFTVLSMAIVAFLKGIKNKLLLNWRITAHLAMGSVFGGIAGDYGFRILIEQFASQIVTLVQNIVLIILLVGILIYVWKQNLISNYHVNNGFIIFIIGVFLGTLSSFLSIGGGPINICILMLLFSMDAKAAAIHSIVIIIFTQMSSIASMSINVDIASLNLTLLPVMVIGGVLGGFIGSKIQYYLDTENVSKVYVTTVIFLIGVNSINIWRILL